jgi:hypothetical protein
MKRIASMESQGTREREKSVIESRDQERDCGRKLFSMSGEGC